MQNLIPLTLHRGGQQVETIDFSVKRMFNAGWAGSDKAALQHHIDELGAVGVPAPKHVPTLFALGNHLLTASDAIQVHGEHTSGEVEYVLLWHEGEVLVTVGSDHTDRKLETHSLAKSKNLCHNVIAAEAWPYDEVRDHFGQLELTCHITRNGSRSLYQQGTCAGLLQPERWVEEIVERSGGLTDGLVFLSGTIGTVEGLVTGDGYDFTMRDPVLDREIIHGYRCEVLTGAIEDY